MGHSSIPLFTRSRTIVLEQLIHIPLVCLSALVFRRVSRIVAPRHNRLKNRLFPPPVVSPCRFFIFILHLVRVSHPPLSQKRLINLTDACCSRTSHCLQMLAPVDAAAATEVVVPRSFTAWLRCI